MIFDNIVKRENRRSTYALLLFTAGLLTACGTQQAETEQEQTVQAEGNGADLPQPVSGGSEYEQVIDDGDLTANGSEEEAEPAGSAGSTPEHQQADELLNRFGENCISEQTFEVELSEYDGKVWFVPYAPGGEGQELELQIVQEGEMLTDLYPYVPESLEGQPFTSLDAVSFFDVNYDGCTDIVLIETYGGTSFVAIYYGFDAATEGYGRMFYSQASLSEAITERINPLTIGELRNWLSEKKNGEFANYKEAYTSVLRLCELSYEPELTCDLIYLDEDDIPELVVADNGFWVSLYTYHDGMVHMLMEQWGYGVMGNAGYEYIPGGNRVRNYNSDYAGAIRYSTYMSMNDQYSLKTVTEAVTYNFDDANGDGYPDADEEDSIGYYSVSYVDGVEITNEQYAAYDAGGYEFIAGKMSMEEMLRALTE